jgi:chaperone required for assembly of F1-ATPase
VTTKDSEAGRRTFKADVAAADGGFAVRIDGKPLKTPAGRPVVVPSRPLADAIAAEWHGQGAKPDLNRVPLTRIAATALDRIPPRRDDVVAELTGYAETELVCHRASEPAALVARQIAAWQPLLDWLAQRFDAPLAATVGVLPRAQSASSLAALRQGMAALDDFRLAGLSVAVAAAGSLVIGLALVEKRLDAEQAFDAAELDATYQIEQWGEDEIARQRRAEVRDDLEAAARFLRLLAAG